MDAYNFLPDTDKCATLILDREVCVHGARTGWFRGTGDAKMNIDWGRFIDVMIIGEWLVFLQALFSFWDGFFSATQMSRKGHHGYSFLQHGGMWCDVIIITPLVAYLVGKYQFAYLSPLSITIAIVALVVWTALAVFVFTPAGKIMPEAHTHDGYVTEAGWILVVYATLASWVIVMWYVSGLETPPISENDVAIVSFVLIPWAILSVIKISPIWKLNYCSTTQTAVKIIGIAVLAWWRLW